MIGCTQLELFVRLELCLPAFFWIQSPTATGCQACLFQVPLERPAAHAQAFESCAGQADLSSQASELSYVVAQCIFRQNKWAQGICSPSGGRLLQVTRCLEIGVPCFRGCLITRRRRARHAAAGAIGSTMGDASMFV